MIDELLKRAEDWNPEAYKLIQPELRRTLVRMMTPEIVSWLKTRAKGIKGAFQPDLVEAALRFLPRWRITQTTGLLHINSNTTDSLERYLSDRSNKRTWWGAFDWKIKHRFDLKSGYEFIDEIKIAPLLNKKIHVDHPVVGMLYASKVTKGDQYDHVDHPAIGVVAYQITEPDGKTFLVLDKPRRHNEALVADSFWKWAYENSLDWYARKALPTEEEEQEQKRRDAIAKGQGICGVCFEIHSLHDKGGMVQHGYRMWKGHGHGHWGMTKAGGDCYGVGWQSWEKSPKAAQSYIDVALKPKIIQIDQQISIRKSGTYQGPIYIYVTRWDKPKRVSKDFQGRGEGQKQTITPDLPAWNDLMQEEIDSLELSKALLEKEIEWFNTAINNWPAYPKAML